MRETADKRRSDSPTPDTAFHAANISDQGTRDLRTLMALAAALQHLALDSGPREATLYLSAAAMLHRRAADLAGLRPPESDSQKSPQRATPRKRVDIRI